MGSIFAAASNVAQPAAPCEARENIFVPGAGFVAASTRMTSAVSSCGATSDGVALEAPSTCSGQRERERLRAEVGVSQPTWTTWRSPVAASVSAHVGGGLALELARCVVLSLWEDGDAQMVEFLYGAVGLEGVRVECAAQYFAATVGTDIRWTQKCDAATKLADRALDIVVCIASLPTYLPLFNIRCGSLVQYRAQFAIPRWCAPTGRRRKTCPQHLVSTTATSSRCPRRPCRWRLSARPPVGRQSARAVRCRKRGAPLTTC